MFSQRIRDVMEPEALPAVPPDGTVAEAAQLMAAGQAGAVLVLQGGELLGIFTASDAVHRVLAQGLDAKATRLADVMTAPVRTVQPDWTLGRALQLMHQHGLRQMPVIEGGHPVGVLRARDALDPELEEFACEAQRRQAYTMDPPPRSTPRGV